MKFKEWEKIYYANSNQKKDGVAKLISDILDLKKKTVTMNKGHFIMIKGAIYIKDRAIIYVPHNRAPKYMERNLSELIGKTNSSTITTVGLNTLNNE